MTDRSAQRPSRDISEDEPPFWWEEADQQIVHREETGWKPVNLPKKSPPLPLSKALLLIEIVFSDKSTLDAIVEATKWWHEHESIVDKRKHPTYPHRANHIESRFGNWFGYKYMDGRLDSGRLGRALYKCVDIADGMYSGPNDPKIIEDLLKSDRIIDDRGENSDG